MTVKTLKVISPVSVMGRKMCRSFEKDEKVTEAELELVIEHIRKCFEPSPEK